MLGLGSGGRPARPGRPAAPLTSCDGAIRSLVAARRHGTGCAGCPCFVYADLDRALGPCRAAAAGVRRRGGSRWRRWWRTTAVRGAGRIRRWPVPARHPFEVLTHPFVTEAVVAGRVVLAFARGAGPVARPGARPGGGRLGGAGPARGDPRRAGCARPPGRLARDRSGPSVDADRGTWWWRRRRVRCVTRPGARSPARRAARTSTCGARSCAPARPATRPGRPRCSPSWPGARGRGRWPGARSTSRTAVRAPARSRAWSSGSSSRRSLPTRGSCPPLTLRSPLRPREPSVPSESPRPGHLPAPRRIRPVR